MAGAEGSSRDAKVFSLAKKLSWGLQIMDGPKASNTIAAPAATAGGAVEPTSTRSEPASIAAAGPPSSASDVGASSPQGSAEQLLPPLSLTTGSYSGNGSGFAHDTANRTENRVVLGRVLGAGAYGTVYKGTWNDIPVAIKTVNVDLRQHGTLTNLAVQAATVNEADIACPLRHPNVVSTYQCLRRSQPGVSWEQRLIQELCDSDLSSLMARGVFTGRFTLVDGRKVAASLHLDCVLQVAQDMASGLHYLASQGVIHADVQPRNLLVKLVPAALPMGCVIKLADFGLSVRLARGASQAGGIKHGTQFYAAPEVCLKGTVCLASDVYSFGVVVWEMLSGRTPFMQDKASGALAWRPEFPLLPDSIPAAVKQLLYPCLLLDPAKRPDWPAIIAQLMVLRHSLAEAEAAALGPHSSTPHLSPSPGRTSQQQPSLEEGGASSSSPGPGSAANRMGAGAPCSSGRQGAGSPASPPGSLAAPGLATLPAR